MTYKEILDKLIENVKDINTYINVMFVREIPDGQFVKVVIGDRNSTLHVYGNGKVFLNGEPLKRIDAPEANAHFKDYADLCLHWQTVKVDLATECKRLNSINRIICGFEI